SPSPTLPDAIALRDARPICAGFGVGGLQQSSVAGVRRGERELAAVTVVEPVQEEPGGVLGDAGHQIFERLWPPSTLMDAAVTQLDRKSTRLNSSHEKILYVV